MLVHPKLKIGYFSASDFVKYYVSQVSNMQQVHYSPEQVYFTQSFTNYDVLVMEDIQHLARANKSRLAFADKIVGYMETLSTHTDYREAVNQVLASVGEFYQAMDFGVRCYLLGYRILTTRALALQFPERVSIIEDRSLCEGVNRFYTKALSIRHIAGKNVAEKWKPYVDKELFNEEIKKKQLLLQKTDFFTLVQKWKAPEQDD